MHISIGLEGSVRSPFREPARLTALVAAVALLAACGDAGSVMNVSVPRADRVPGAILEVRSAERTIQLEGDDFKTNPGQRSTGTFPVANSGTIQVSFVSHASGDTLTDGSVSFEARPEFSWGVTVYIYSSDPTGACLGCFGHEAFPIAPDLREEPGDSLWISWGGKERDSDAIY